MHSSLESTAATATGSTSAAVTPTGTATATESGVSAASVTTPVESHSSATEGQSIGTSSTVEPLPSLGPTISASGTASAKSVAGKVEYGGTGKWIGIVAGIMGLWILPMMI